MADTLSQRPKVSVLVLAYRHEQFLRQALESVLGQVTDFEFDVVVGEDCSPDHTRRIVQEFERRYPARVRPIYHPANVGMGANLRACLAACRGQYIALLEGDDYWTSPHKLQRQVDWLDAHPDFSICFHPVQDQNEDGSPSPTPPRQYPQDEYTFEDLLLPIYTVVSTGSTMLRNVLTTWPEWLFAAKPIDFALTLLYAEHGRAKLLPEAMSAYRMHPGGIWSGTARHRNIESFLRMYEQLHRHYAGTRHAPALRRHLFDLYLTTANVHANTGHPAAAAGFVRQALRLGPGPGTPLQPAAELLGAALRLARAWLRPRDASTD